MRVGRENGFELPKVLLVSNSVECVKLWPTSALIKEQPQSDTVPLAMGFSYPKYLKCSSRPQGIEAH